MIFRIDVDFDFDLIKVHSKDQIIPINDKRAVFQGIAWCQRGSVKLNCCADNKIPPYDVIWQ